ncbi:hypothetical protein [Stenotrophomonas sp. MMGLT7]|nr:hypothetical protein [Stenotrophomonas sp. MMGLT7]
MTLVLTLLYRPRDLRWLLPALAVTAESVAVLLYDAPAGNCNMAS